MHTSKNLWLASALLTVLTACQPSPQTKTVSNAEPEVKSMACSTQEYLLLELQPAVETRQIQPEQSQTVRFSKGTEIHVPADCFQFEDGTSPKGTVELKVKECYSWVDFLSEELHTLSGDALLETGGTVHVSAECDGQSLFLKEGSELGLNFASESAKLPGMQTFYGVQTADGSLDWVAGESQTEDINAIEAYEVVRDYIPVDFNNIDSTLLTPEMYYSRLHVGRYMSQFEDYPTHWALLGTLLTFNQEFDRLAEKVDLGSQRACENMEDLEQGVCGVECDITFNEAGAISEIHFLPNDLPVYELAVREVLKHMPYLDMRRMPDIKARKTYRFGFTTWRIFDREAYAKAYREAYAKERVQKVQIASARQLAGFTVRANRMGWINCDRFARIPAHEKTEVVVTAAPSDAQLMLAFQEINAVMRPEKVNDRWVFSGVPKNAGVKLIGVTYDENGPQLGMRKLTVTGEPIALDAFRPVTLDELGQALGGSL